MFYDDDYPPFMYVVEIQDNNQLSQVQLDMVKPVKDSPIFIPFWVVIILIVLLFISMKG